MPNENQWHLDKRVPIAMITTMIGQVAAVAIAAAFMFKDIESNRMNIEALSSRVMVLDRAAGAQAVQLGRIEESISGMRGDVNRLLNIIERRFTP